MPNVPYSYEVNGKLVTGNGSLIPISSLTKRSLLPSLTVPHFKGRNLVTDFMAYYFIMFEINSIDNWVPTLCSQTWQ